MMGLFGFLRPEPFKHPQLGTLLWSGGYWRGALDVPSHGVTQVLLAGSRSGPEISAAELASQFSSRYPSLIPAIERALIEHYAPYQEAVAAGEFREAPGPFPTIKVPSAVWPHVKLEYILIEPLSGVMAVEMAYTTSWDLEHTLGARFGNWQFLELCGSVRRLA
jgi:hypothetical protein